MMSRVSINYYRMCMVSCHNLLIKKTVASRLNPLIFPLRGLKKCYTHQSVSQSVSHYHTPSRELMAHTHTLLLSSFQVCGRYLCIFFFFFIFLLAGIALQDDVHGDVSSFFPSLSPIFWLAQILQRADLGDEPEHPLEVAVHPTKSTHLLLVLFS